MKLNKYLFKSVTSTNDIAIKKIKQGMQSGLIIANKQTKGRGRYGNKWIYLKNNLFMSVFFKLNNNISLRKLTITSCKLVKKSLLKILNKKITIKKPNDLLINNKKVCGILQETMFYNKKRFVIVGIGINLFKSPSIKKYPTTHLSNYVKRVNKLLIIKNVKKQYEKKINYLKLIS